MQRVGSAAAEARSAFKPKVSLSTNVQGNIGQVSVDGGPNQGIVQPQAGVFLRFEWPLYQGGLLENRLALSSFPAYVNGFLLALKFTPLVSRLVVEAAAPEPVAVQPARP